MTKVGRDLWRLFSPSSALEQGQPLQVLQECSQGGVNNSLNGHSTTSLGNLFQCLTTFIIKKAFSYIQIINFLYFHLCLLPHPVTGHQQEQNWPCFVWSGIYQVFIEVDNTPPEPPLLHTKESAVSASSQVRDAPVLEPPQ